MPIDVSTPDGSTFSFPDGTEPDIIKGALDKHFGRAEPPSIPADMAKSGGIGLAKGAIGMAGMGADARELQAKAINAASKAFGYEIPHETVSQVLRFLPLMGGATSEELQKQVEDVTGKFYEPKTTAGKYAQTVGEFAPAVIGGPEGLATKAATRVLAPALASEAAGQLAEGKDAEPYVRPAAALAAAVATHRLTAPRAPGAPIPEAEQLRTAARQEGYEHPSVAAVQIEPASVSRLADVIAADLNRRGQLPTSMAAPTHRTLEQLRNTGQTPGLPQGVTSIPEIRAVRMSLGDMAKELDPVTARATPNAVAAGRAGRVIDSYLESMAARPQDIIAGDPAEAARRLQAANRDWAAASKSASIDLQQMKADRQAGKNGSGSNIENSMRQKIDQIFGPGRETAGGLSAAEQAAADQLVMGSNTRNSLRKFGKLGFGDGMSLLMHMVAAAPTLGSSIPIGIAGTIARKVGEGMTRRDIAALDRMIRARAPEAQRWQALAAQQGALPQPSQLPQLGLLSGIYSQPLLAREPATP